MNSQDFRNLQEAYLDVYENEQLDEMPYKVFTKNNKGEEVSVGGIYATRKTARTRADRGDEIDGGVTHNVRKVSEAIRSHLIDEGYAETPEAAEVMIANMSEEWREDILNEGIGSAIKSLFGKKKKPEAPKAPEPLSRGAQLRAKYNTGPEKSNTSVKRAIINRARGNATRAQDQVNRGNASQSYADKATGAVDSYLKAGYSKYGAGPGSGGEGGSGFRGGGHKARKRAAALNNSYDLFDYMMEYLITEGYADTNENALVIMANMSEEWKNSIIG